METSEEKGEDSSIIGNVLTFYKKKCIHEYEIKMEFLNMSKRNKMNAATIWKAVDFGYQDVYIPRAFAIPLAFRCFRKGDLFHKALMETRGYQGQGSRGWERSRGREEGESAFTLPVKLKVVGAWFLRFPARAVHWGPQRLQCGVYPSFFSRSQPA